MVEPLVDVVDANQIVTHATHLKVHIILQIQVFSVVLPFEALTFVLAFLIYKSWASDLPRI